MEKQYVIKMVVDEGKIAESLRKLANIVDTKTDEELKCLEVEEFDYWATIDDEDAYDVDEDDEEDV